MSESLGDQKKSLLVLGALGIVYGDIGTSPLYALRECFSQAIGLTTTPPTILGILSLNTTPPVAMLTVQQTEHCSNVTSANVCCSMGSASNSVLRFS